MNVQVNPDEDTEWNDILRAHGVIPEKPPSPTAELEQAFEEAVQKAHENRLEGKSLDELDELEEEGLEDEDFVAMYRAKRMAELKEMAGRERFGRVYHISKPEYKEEITDASQNGVYVIVHLSYPGILQSKLLSGLYEVIAPKFKDIKFVEIDARQVNDKYPQENCPTILIYKDTDVLKQYVTLSTIGGNSTNIKDLERLLVTIGAVPSTDPRLTVNQEEEEGSRGIRSTIKSRHGGWDSDDDDKFE
ncbi:phosducin-like protein 2 [Trichomonascus vanleenenianus]|uniref:Plp2p n=1 Tax=Trichomonascus vanleenenianus TaxID=2268995 RepID=UPI003EC9CBE8